MFEAQRQPEWVDKIEIVTADAKSIELNCVLQKSCNPKLGKSFLYIMA
jgi:hypothetical protein